MSPIRYTRDGVEPPHLDLIRSQVTGGSPLDEPDGGGGDPFTTAVHHPFLALAGLVVFLGVIALVNWVVKH